MRGMAVRAAPDQACGWPEGLTRPAVLEMGGGDARSGESPATGASVRSFWKANRTAMGF